MNIQNKKELQLELWRECNVRCTYCYNGCFNIRTTDDEKIKNLTHIFEIISDLTNYTEKKFNVISFIGGEFFQGQMKNDDVRKIFFQIIDKVNWLLENNYICEFWLCASLVIGDQKDFYDTINKISDHTKLWVCTSYDSVGRFHTEKLRENWLNHMHNLIENYLDIKLNITTILTGDFINKYINHELSVIDYIRLHKDRISLFLKPPEPLLISEDTFCSKEDMNEKIPNFFPKRNDFLKFLLAFKSQEEESMYNSICNMNLRCDLFYKFVDGDIDIIAHRLKDEYQEKFNGRLSLLSCGHSAEYNMYIDNNGCCICDKEMIKKI